MPISGITHTLGMGGWYLIMTGQALGHKLSTTCEGALGKHFGAIVLVQCVLNHKIPRLGVEEWFKQNGVFKHHQTN
jgi:hypothetical protein